jgi:hypothetical protein
MGCYKYIFTLFAVNGIPLDIYISIFYILCDKILKKNLCLMKITRNLNVSTNKMTILELSIYLCSLVRVSFHLLFFEFRNLFDTRMYKVSLEEHNISRVLWNCAALYFYCFELCRAVKVVKSDVNTQM